MNGDISIVFMKLYPLVNIRKKYQTTLFKMDKSTISMAIYQRVTNNKESYGVDFPMI